MYTSMDTSSEPQALPLPTLPLPLPLPNPNHSESSPPPEDPMQAVDEVTMQGSQSSSSSHHQHHRHHHHHPTTSRAKPRFSKQKGSQSKETINIMKKAITDLSGGDDILLLQAVLESHFGKQHGFSTSEVKPPTKANTIASKFENIIYNILAQHKSAPDRQKRRWASLVAPILTHKEMRSFGFEISNNGFAHARKHAQELGPGAELPKTALPTKNERTRSKRDKKKDPLEEVLEEVVEEELTSELPPPNLGALGLQQTHHHDVM